MRLSNSKKVLAVLTCLTLLFGAVCADAVTDFVADKYEPGDVTYEIEAEAFAGKGFYVQEDASASGGKCLVGQGGGQGTMDYTFELASDVEKFVIYGVHQAKYSSQALSYISIDDFEHYSLYDYTYGAWNRTRLFYGNMPAGKYTIHLTSVRAGQKIDKFIIKYNQIDPPTTETAAGGSVQQEADGTVYRPANPDAEALAVTELKERVPGSYFGECEDGTYSKAEGIAVQSEDASGGAYWVSALKDKLLDPNTEKTNLRFKFYVSQKGYYKLWLRYLTPYADAKDIYLSFDEQGWKTFDDSKPSGRFLWKSSLGENLDVGWHTVDFKHRTNGQYYDCFIITNNAGFSPSGYGSLPGEEKRPDAANAAFMAGIKLHPKVKSNNYRVGGDAEFEFVGDDIMLPSSNLAGALGIVQQPKDGYFLLERGRKYLKYVNGSDRAISSGREIYMNKAVHATEEDDILMVSLKAAQKTFGFDYAYDAAENTLHIYDFYDAAEVREASDEELWLDAGRKYLYYTIPYENANAKAEVWVRPRVSDTVALANMNWDNLNTIAAGGDNYKLTNQYTAHGEGHWYRAQTPVYRDGAFRGAQFVVDSGRVYDVKVVLTDNGKQSTFAKTVKKTVTGWESKLPPEEYKYQTNGELYLVPTFENIGYYIDTDCTDGVCAISYRKAGEEAWSEVFRPVWDFETNQFRGTIPFLDENTEYEVKAVITRDGQVVKESTASVRTWADEPPIAQTIKLRDIYRGDGDLTLLDLKGDENGWIKVDGEGMTVNAHKDFYAAVSISGCEHLIFENVTVRGGTDFGITIDENSHDVRIVNCDIAEWGMGSIQDADLGAFFRSGVITNQRAAVAPVSSVNLVVERCYIHDSDSNTNAWRNKNYSSLHPAGSCAVMMWGKRGTVIRYNDMIGSDLHRFNDVLEGAQNGGRGPGSCGSDSDIYGNLLCFSNDDSMELDGGQMNVRVYQNRIEQTYCGISTAPNTMGPSYIYRNLIVKLGDETGRTGVSMKTGGSPDAWPLILFFNNTFEASGGCLSGSHYGGSYEYHAVTRNTIFAALASTGGYSKSGKALLNEYADERDDYDYDLLYGRTAFPPGNEKHAVLSPPVYVSAAVGDYHLASTSPGYRAGTSVPGFTATETPNIGAFADDAYDAPFLPARPMDMASDVYTLSMNSGETKAITVSFGAIEEGLTCSLLKNRDFGWLEFADTATEEIAVKPNTSLTFHVKAVQSGKGAVLVRMSNGLSVPVLIYADEAHTAK